MCVWLVTSFTKADDDPNKSMTKGKVICNRRGFFFVQTNKKKTLVNKEKKRRIFMDGNTCAGAVVAPQV
jgi:hypothetical protein